MTIWEQLTCPTCGSNGVEIIDGLLCCKYCKSKHTLQEKISEEEVIALNNATTDRQRWAFDEAFEKYELLLQKYPDNEMANWGALLCDFGFTYEKDPFEDKLVPTCHRLNTSSILQSPYYGKLNREHKERADKLEKLRLAILEESKRIQPYDVFICYKKTEEGNEKERTKEFRWALEIYNMLKYELGLRVFFSEESLEGHSSGWEPHIYAALRSAKLMYIVTSSIEHVNATWVKNEWKRYAKYVHDGEEKQIQVVYEGFDVAQLPMELRKYQAIDRDKRGWDKKVKKVAEEIFIDPLEEERKKKEREEEARRAQDEARQKEREQQAAMQAIQDQLAALQAAQATQTVEVGSTKADKYCVKCGMGLGKNVQFCPECGGNSFAPKSYKYCNQCGETAQLTQAYCSKCRNSKFVWTKEEYVLTVERRDFDITDTGILTKYKGKLAAVKIPERVKGIAPRAFSGCNWVTSVVIPNNVIFIGDGAFSNCSGLTSITLSNYTPKLPDELFYGCKNLRSVHIPEIVSSIGNKAFFGCSALTGFEIPNRVKVIGEEAFHNCISMQSVKFGTGLEKICKSAFAHSGLTSVTLPNGVKTIETSAFANCESLESTVIPQSVTSIGEGAFENCKNLTNVSISNGVKTIETSAFANCKSLGSIVIPQSVTAIEESAFENCNSLTNVSISNGVKTIETSAFANCKSLESIVIPQTVTLIEESAFENCENLTNLSISNGVETIGNYAFSGCVGLKSITIPDSVTSIGDDAFGGCSHLEHITFGNRLQEIGDRAFHSCKVSDVTIPDSVNIIGEGAFSGCSALARISIGSGVSEMEGALQACNRLTNIEVNEKNNDYKSVDGNLYSKDGKRLIKYPVGKKESDFEIPRGVNVIEESALAGCTSLKSIVIPDSVSSIGENAFLDCKFTSVTCPARAVSQIGGRYFIETLTITSGNKLEENLFKKELNGTRRVAYSHLTNLTLPKSINWIGDYAFAACRDLQRVEYGGKVADWKNLQGNDCFLETGLQKIVCADGDISVEAERKRIQKERERAAAAAARAQAWNEFWEGVGDFFGNIWESISGGAGKNIVLTLIFLAIPWVVLLCLSGYYLSLGSEANSVLSMNPAYVLDHWAMLVLFALSAAIHAASVGDDHWGEGMAKAQTARIVLAVLMGVSGSIYAFVLGETFWGVVGYLIVSATVYTPAIILDVYEPSVGNRIGFCFEILLEIVILGMITLLASNSYDAETLSIMGILLAPIGLLVSRLVGLLTKHFSGLNDNKYENLAYCMDIGIYILSAIACIAGGAHMQGYDFTSGFFTVVGHGVSFYIWHKIIGRKVDFS